jgi:hypothetical protein
VRPGLPACIGGLPHAVPDDGDEVLGAVELTSAKCDIMSVSSDVQP